MKLEKQFSYYRVVLKNFIFSYIHIIIEYGIDTNMLDKIYRHNTINICRQIYYRYTDTPKSVYIAGIFF